MATWENVHAGFYDREERADVQLVESDAGRWSIRWKYMSSARTDQYERLPSEHEAKVRYKELFQQRGLQ